MTAIYKWKFIALPDNVSLPNSGEGLSGSSSERFPMHVIFNTGMICLSSIDRHREKSEIRRGLFPRRMVQFESAIRWIMSSGHIAQNLATHLRLYARSEKFQWYNCRDLSGKILVF